MTTKRPVAPTPSADEPPAPNLALARAHGLNLTRWNGDHITGIPALNLTPAMVAELNDKQVLACLATGLYQIAPAAVEEGETTHE